jgi:hypothetical protein
VVIPKSALEKYEFVEELTEYGFPVTEFFDNVVLVVHAKSVNVFAMPL